ncbi:MAG: hypothetical protein FWG65_12125 [Turicibacter sp.]|nr:hypothetical protein [Turicibacter sp.]
MKLYEYESKIVKVVDTDGDVFIGFVDFYTSALDEPDGIPSITMIPHNIPDWDKNALLGIYENEIASIEIYETAEVAD